MSDGPPPGRFFATAAKGTEPALRDELRELRFRGVRADRGGVHFDGDRREAFRACLELRTAVRVLERLADFDAPDGDALYEGVRAIAWDEHLTQDRTLAVRAVVRSSALTHSQFVAQKTKDAIVDPFRERTGARPSVDLDDPDVLLFVHLVKDRATVYLDASGDALHRRGYRKARGEAPLKETLAAAILRLAKWDRERPLLDPMCGSGTIAIEGALWARGIAPNLERAFGFERWASHDQGAKRAITELREAARERAHDAPAGPLVIASDVDPDAIAQTRENADRARVRISATVRDARDVEPTSPPGHVVTNPPYDERLPMPPELAREIGRALGRLRGHRVSILAGAPSLARIFPFRPASSHAVWNGDIECRLLGYEIRA